MTNQVTVSVMFFDLYDIKREPFPLKLWLTRLTWAISNAYVLIFCIHKRIHKKKVSERLTSVYFGITKHSLSCLEHIQSLKD